MELSLRSSFKAAALRAAFLSGPADVAWTWVSVAR